MSVLYDDTAERVIQLGGKPHLTMSALMEATKIEEESGDSFTSKEIVTSIVADFKYIMKSFSDLSTESEEAGDKTTAAFADDHVASYEKELWILGAMIK